MERSLREEYEARVRARDEVLGLPEPPDQVVAHMRRLVDEAAAQFVADHGRGIVAKLSGHYALSDYRDPAAEYVPVKPQLWYPLQIGWFELFGLAPDAVKDRFEAIIRSQPYAASLPASERPAALARLAGEILELEARHTALVDECAALDPPISLPLLDVVRARREAEAHPAAPHNVRVRDHR